MKPGQVHHFRRMSLICGIFSSINSPQSEPETLGTIASSSLVVDGYKSYIVCKYIQYNIYIYILIPNSRACWV